MVNDLINWLSNLCQEFAKFGTWLTTDLDYIGISPLAIFGFTGILVIIGYLLVRLVVGG